MFHSVTVMLVTTLCWLFYDGNRFKILVTESCVGDFFRYVGDFFNALNRSPTSQTWHQHFLSPKSVTNIDYTASIDWCLKLMLTWLQPITERLASSNLKVTYFSGPRKIENRSVFQGKTLFNRINQINLISKMMPAWWPTNHRANRKHQFEKLPKHCLDSHSNLAPSI